MVIKNVKTVRCLDSDLEQNIIDLSGKAWNIISVTPIVESDVECDDWPIVEEWMIVAVIYQGQ